MIRLSLGLDSRHRRAKVNPSPKMRFAALALATTFAVLAVGSSFAQPRDGAGSGQVSQYCAPKDEESPDARRLYC
jgi:hypothetical protein